MKRRCARLVRRQIDAGIDFLCPCGTTGESPTLKHEEHLRIVEITVEEARGRVPVLAGAGGYDTDEVIELIARIENGRRFRNSFRHAVLQQAHARRSVSALPRNCGIDVASDRGL